jgi:hypothetical protein
MLFLGSHEAYGVDIVNLVRVHNGLVISQSTGQQGKTANERNKIKDDKTKPLLVKN